MKTSNLNIAAVFLLFFLSQRIQAQKTADAICATLLGYEQALMDGVATGDKALWNKYLHDSCLIAIENGEAVTKQKMIAELNPLPKGYIGKIKIIEPRCQMYGNTAVISFINDEYLELYGQKIHTQYRQTDTWVKTSSEWKLVAMQVFEIPKNPPPVTVSETILKQYNGTYQLSHERKCRVYVEAGKLYAQKDEKNIQELLPETENVFFRKGDGRVNVIFLKNTDGTYQMIERREGEDLVWKQSK